MDSEFRRGFLIIQQIQPRLYLRQTAGERGGDVGAIIGLLSSSDYPTLEPLLLELDRTLTLRTYLGGHVLSIDDKNVWTAFRSNKITSGLIRQGRMPADVLRWLACMDAMHPQIQDGVKDAKARAADERASASRAGGIHDLRLPFADYGVVTRFPPEPSGYLHIGHAKAAFVNDYFALEAYRGKLIVRFDDTNPAKESQEFEGLTLKDLDALGIHADRVTHTSDYFPQLYDTAEQMIRDGHAYADDTPQKVRKDQRAGRLPSSRRGRPAHESLTLFKEMRAGTNLGRQHFLRALLKFDSLNGTLRDPVIY